MEAVIQVEDLGKTYPDGTEAVRGISFAVEQGEFFGFLGPNGAGKSTTIKILITLLNATRGRVRIFGLDVNREANRVRKLIGYTAQEVGVDDELTGRENLMLQGHLYHIEAKLLRRRVDELLDLMELAGDADRFAGSYSGGMRKRLDLATGLLHRPQVLFLDEPTTGLDPQNRAAIWTHLERINKEEKLTILLTTHYLEEADRLCDRLAIIDHGRIVVSGAPAALKAELGGDVVKLVFGPDGSTACAQCGHAAQVLAGRDFVESVSESDGQLLIATRQGGRALPSIVRVLDEAGIYVQDMALTSPTLDDVFLKHTGERIRDEAPVENWRNAFAPGGRGRKGLP
jgi:ABC-2 type transport system ATP-binding protein